MDRRKFLLLTGATTAGAAALATGCGSGGGNGGGSASLRVAQYGSAHRIELFEQVFEAYSEKNPDTTLNLDTSGFDNYEDALATQASGGNAPDLMGLFHHVVAQFARQGALLDLDPYIDDGLDTSAFAEGVVDLGQVDGAVHALSYGDNAHGSMYDVDLLEELGLSLPEPGYTWEEYLTFSADITRAVDGDFWGTEDRSSQADMIFKVWLLQRGKHVFTEDGQLGFDKADLTQWLELWQMMRDEGAAPPVDVTAEASGTFENSALVRGYTANHITYANALPSMQSLTESTLRLTTIPVDPDGVGPGHFIRGSNWVAVSARTDHGDEAVDALDFLFNDPEGAAIMGAEMGAPPNRDRRDELDYDEPQQDFVDYIDFITDEFSDPAIALEQEFPVSWNDVNTAFGDAVEDHRFGRVSVSEAVDAFFERAESAVQAAT